MLFGIDFFKRGKNMLTQAPKGTRDVTPSQSHQWQYVEAIARDVAELYGFNEVRTPVFEHTELFLRGVGSTTDVVQKEMYTFEDKGQRSITLKPEGTAGAARAYIEHGMQVLPQPVKMYYFTPVFRYEKPQAGRLREHHQFGVEAFGGASAVLDAEVILLATQFFEKVGLKGLKASINSIGCPNCRGNYSKALIEYFSQHKESLCPTCLERLNKNPLRILDCKEEGCKHIIKDAPLISGYLCDECSTHFELLQKSLKEAGLEFEIDPMIVRGLDYYTKTVFEIIATIDGNPLTVCGGGRYDGLIEELGGPKTCGVGFGLGIERLLLILEKEGLLPDGNRTADVFIAYMGEDAAAKAVAISRELRDKDIKVQTEYNARSFKAQFKSADKNKAKFVIILGAEEIANGAAKVKCMGTGEELTVAFDVLAETTKDLVMEALRKAFEKAVEQLIREEQEQMCSL